MEKAKKIELVAGIASRLIGELRMDERSMRSLLALTGKIPYPAEGSEDFKDTEALDGLFDLLVETAFLFVGKVEERVEEDL